MTRKQYPELDETLYRETLENGLTVLVVPRKGFTKKLAYFVTDFGSIHTDFRLDGKEYHAPAGVAHYLEHKMFDLPGDRDVSAEFAALGASTNAFTSYDMTAYYFSCTNHFDECLRLLLEFVSTPYFTEESVEKERGKNFRFTLTTNGMLIDDDVIDFANREMSNVVLSLDGRKEIHDRLRVDYAGNGSYERIVPKFQKLVEARGNKNYYMRGTFTHANPDFTKDLFHMADLGFTELSMEPVVCAPEDPAALTAEDLEIVKDQYELLARDMLRREKEGKPITFYHYMLDLTGGPCIYKRISGCGSGTEYMAVTPWGDLYPCHQFVGEGAYKLGDIWNGVTNTALREEFRSCNAYARPECNDCWARFYCSGGCAANAFHATGSIRGVYEAGCELFRKRMECAIMMKVAEDSAKANS